MAITFFPLITLCELVLLGWGLRLQGRRRDLAGLFLLLFLAGELLGSLAMSLGGWVAPGPGLETLHRMRLLIQGVCLPLLIYFVYDLVKRTGLDWTGRREAGLAVWSLIFVLVVMQCGARFLREPLTAVRFAGLSYYREAGYSRLPLSFVLSLSLIIAFGLILFRRRGSPWIAAGAFGIFLGAGLPAAFGGPAVNAVLEAAFAASLLWTASRFADASPNE
jgi:hypothetical protein